MRLTPTVLLAVVTLAGCAVPEAHPALTRKPADALGLSATPAPAIASDWWRSFGDPQLDRLVADALAGGPSLDTAMARVRQASALLAADRANDGPNVSLDSNVQGARLSGRYQIPPPYAGTVRFVGTAQAGLNWNLDLFGRQKAVIAQARNSVRAASLDMAAARLALAGSVVQTYVDLSRTERQEAIAVRTIRAREAALQLVNVRIRNKLASNLDRTAAQVLLDQARQAQVRAQSARTISTHALAALAGRGADYAAGIAPANLQLDAAIPLPTSVPADLLARRPDIAAALARIDAASSGQLAAQRAFYPDINLAALIGVQAIDIGNFFNPDAAMAGVGSAIHLPIFDNGRLKANLEGATAGIDLAVADYNSRVIEAVRDASDTLTRVASLDADRASQREIVKGLAETGRLNRVRVASGLNSRLDLVDSDVRLLEAEQAETNLAAEAAAQRVALVLALGGGFDPKEVK